MRAKPRTFMTPRALRTSPCKCGCGELLKANWKGYLPKYVNLGHRRRHERLMGRWRDPEQQPTLLPLACRPLAVVPKNWRPVEGDYTTAQIDAILARQDALRRAERHQPGRAVEQAAWRSAESRPTW